MLEYGRQTLHVKSLPIRGAWIEISKTQSGSNVSAPSLPIRGAWIEIYLGQSYAHVI